MITAIVAVDENMGTGYRGKLAWNNTRDLQYFRETTMGKTVVMGRVTWESLPKRPLEGRRNIVITSQPIEGVETYSSLEQAIEHLNDSEDNYIIGGEMLYRTSIQMGIVDRLLISRIEGFHPADRYFDGGLLEGFRRKYITTGEGLKVETWTKG